MLLVVVILITVVTLATCSVMIARQQREKQHREAEFLATPVWSGAWASGQQASGDLTTPPVPPPVPEGARLRQEKEIALPDSIFEHVTTGLEKVPPLPQALFKVLHELEDVGSSARSIASIVATEPVLAATLLRIVNSAATGLRREILSVDEAVTYLGFNTVKTLVLKLKLAQVLPDPGKQGDGYDHQQLWLHSLAVGQLAEHLSKRVGGVDPWLASTVGLLHDIGKLAINSQFPRIVPKLWQDRQGDESFLARERRLFGADHAYIGAFLAERWKLPADLVEAIRLHHMPADGTISTLRPELRRAISVVHVANQLAKYCHVYCADMEIDIVHQSVLEWLGLPDVEKLLDQKVRQIVLRSTLIAQEATSAARPLKQAS